MAQNSEVPLDTRILYVLDLGLADYDFVWALQKRAAAARISE